MFDDVLKKDSTNFEACIGKATVLLSQHHFTDAIPVALEAQKINPYSSAVYGILTDAFLENGDYIFEVKNSSKSELKTSIKIIIGGTHESDR